MEETYEKVCLIAAECFKKLDMPLTEETKIEDLGGDSLDALNLQLSIEDEFDIQITEEEFLKELADEATLGSITRFIEKKK